MRIILEQGVNPALRGAVTRVRDAYLRSLKDGTLLSLKLSRLTVRVFNRGEDRAHNPEWDGCFRQVDESFRIQVCVGGWQSLEDVTFVIAHEFAHLLFCMVHSPLGEPCADGFLFVSSVSRDLWREADCFEDRDGEADASRSLQHGLEEFCADALARYILVKLGQSPDWLPAAEREGNRETLRERLDCIDRYAALFGKPLLECEALDGFSEDEDGQVHVSNAFWYACVAFQMRLIADWMDREAGEGTYMRVDLEFSRLQFGGKAARGNYVRMNRLLEKLSELTPFHMPRATASTVEFRRVFLQDKLRFHRDKLEGMLNHPEFDAFRAEVTHPRLGKGEILSVCEKRALLRLNGRDVTMPFDQMVEECAFTGRRDAPLILAHFAVDRMRTLLREIRENEARRAAL